MPLSAAAAAGVRTPIHRRVIDASGYRRDDGLWDIEGRLTDTKTYPFANRWRGELAPGTPVHDMLVRLTIDDDLVVQAIEAVTDASPFRVCPEVTPNFQALKGVKIGAGWNRSVRDRLGGVHGCTHLIELLGRLGTVAYQTVFPIREREREAKRAAGAASAAEPGAGDKAARAPRLLDSCYAWRADGPVVEEYFPAHYRGQRE